MASEKTYLVICAMAGEFEALANKVREGRPENHGGIDGLGFPLPYGRAFAFAGRIGKVNTAFDIGRLSAVLDIGGIVNTGVAGAVSETVKPLDVVIADRVAFHDVDLTAFGSPLGQMDGEPLWFETDPAFIAAARRLEHQTAFSLKIGPVISGDKFVTKENLQKDVIKLFGHPLAVDMESGAVAQVARHLGVPFCIIRSISDDTRDKENEDTYHEFMELAAKHASEVTLWLLNALKD